MEFLWFYLISFCDTCALKQSYDRFLFIGSILASALGKTEIPIRIGINVKLDFYFQVNKPNQSRLKASLNGIVQTVKECVSCYTKERT